MKKLLATFFAFALVVTSTVLLAGCGEKDFDKNKIKITGTEYVYDGNSHICEIIYEDSEVNPEITYSLDGSNYVAKAKIDTKSATNEYPIYFKLSAEGYKDYISSVNMKVNPSVQIKRGSAILNYATFASALENAQDGDEIKLFNDVTLDSTVAITKTISINGQGNKIVASQQFEGYNVFELETKDTIFTLKNVTVDANLKARVIYVNSGKLIIDGATIQNGNRTDGAYPFGVYITNSASFEMKSGSIVGNNDTSEEYNKKYCSDLWIGANANAVISGGKIGNMFVNANSYSQTNKGKTVMNGGEIASLWVEYGNGYGAEFTYNDGTITKLSVSTEVEGQAVEVTPVKGTTYVGGITEYANNSRVKSVSTYSALVNAINNSFVDIVKLTEDIDVETTVEITRSLKLDLNGKKLYNSQDLWDTTYCVLRVKGEDIDVVLTGNGQIVAKKDDCYAIEVKNGNLTIENGTIKGNCSAVQVATGKLTILGGTFEDQQKYIKDGDTQYTYTLNCIDASCESGCANILVKGGTFVNFNPANCLAEGEGTNFVADGYKAQLVEGSETDYIVVAE